MGFAEVQKLGDVGKEDHLFVDDSVQLSGSSNQQGHEPRSQSSNSLETHKVNPKQNVVHSQTKPKEGRASLELNKANVFALEHIKNELEEILNQKIKAEVEYVVILETIQNLTTGPLDQIKLVMQQKRLALEQVQVMAKLEGAETKAMELKRQAEKLETTCEEILESEEVWKLEHEVRKLTSCFTVQLMLLLLAVYMLILQFPSVNLEVAPT